MADYIPEVRIDLEEEGSDGAWHQKFTLFDSTDPDKVYPVDYAGAKLDLTDAIVLADLWRKYGPRLSDVAEGGD